MNTPEIDTDEKRTFRLHRESLVIDCHSDVHLDVIRSRGKGETRVLERRHLPRWREAGLNVVVLSSMAKFGLDPYPYWSSPVNNSLLMADTIHQEIEESPHCFLLILEPEDIEGQGQQSPWNYVGSRGGRTIRDESRLLAVLFPPWATYHESDLAPAQSGCRWGG